MALLLILLDRSGEHRQDGNQQVQFASYATDLHRSECEPDGYNWDSYRYRYDSDVSPPTMHIGLGDVRFNWFQPMLSNASVDFELARILREHALQCGPDAQLTGGWENIARASLEYVQVSAN